jgi:hypothetical protein
VSLKVETDIISSISVSLKVETDIISSVSASPIGLHCIILYLYVKKASFEFHKALSHLTDRTIDLKMLKRLKLVSMF